MLRLHPLLHSGETEAQSREGTCLMSLSMSVTELGLPPGLPTSRVPAVCLDSPLSPVSLWRVCLSACLRPPPALTEPGLVQGELLLLPEQPCSSPWMPLFGLLFSLTLTEAWGWG